MSYKVIVFNHEDAVRLQVGEENMFFQVKLTQEEAHQLLLDLQREMQMGTWNPRIYSQRPTYSSEKDHTLD